MMLGMNLAEEHELLVLASVIDNRRVEVETTKEWHRIVGHITFETARAAMELHFRESPTYWMPSHLVADARRIRDERIRALDAAPPAHPEQMSSRARIWKGIDPPSPKPNNFDAMIACWSGPNAARVLDRVQWAREIAAYNEQLRKAGLAPAYPEPLSVPVDDRADLF
jgi:hypothetical protein